MFGGLDHEPQFGKRVNLPLERLLLKIRVSASRDQRYR